MTRPENAVAIAERALAIEGSVSPSALRRIDKQGNFAADPTTAALFASFAFADLPIGWTFSHVWSVDDPSEVQEVDGIVEACTQQFGEPFEEVPHGWKTIILFRFRGNVPELVTALPVSDSWTYQPVLHFGSKEAWCAAVANASAAAEHVDLHSIAANVDDESSFLDFIQRLAADRAHARPPIHPAHGARVRRAGRTARSRLSFLPPPHGAPPQAMDCPTTHHPGTRGSGALRFS